MALPGSGVMDEPSMKQLLLLSQVGNVNPNSASEFHHLIVNYL